MDLSRFFVVIGARTEELTKGLNDASSKLSRFGQSVNKAGKNLTLGLTMPIVGAGIASLKMAADFESAMREVNTMLLLNEDEFKGLSDDVQQLAKDMGVSATDSAKALYQAISAGVPKENAIEFLTVATKAAIGGVTDTATAVDGLTTVMNAFKIPVGEAERVADLMFITVKGGKTTFEELSASLFQVAPMAATAGIKFETVSAALATMTKQGVPTSVATTQLRQAIQAIIKPTADMKTALDTLGYASGDALLAEKGFQGALELLTQSAGGSNEVLGKMFGSVEGLQAVFALTGENAATFQADIDAMSNSAGAATDAFDQMEQSTSRQFALMVAQFKDTAITLGNALIPALTKLMETVGPIIEKVANWISENPKLTATILGIAAAVGPLLMILGNVLMVIPAIAGALPLLGAAFTAMLGPVGLIIAAIAAAIAIGVLIIKNWDKVKAAASTIWNGIKSVISTIGNAIKWYFENMTPIGFIINNWELISKVATKIFGGIVKFFEGIPGKVKSAFSSLADIMLAPFRLYVKGLEAAINWIIRQINKISIDIPDWVPVFGGRHWGIDIPEISLPHFEHGGIVTQPTLAMIGEAGPEAVIPLNNPGAAGININIYGNWSIREEADINRIARELGDVVTRKMRLQGA
jgi:TP901 family phage tail tape measure protein